MRKPAPTTGNIEQSDSTSTPVAQDFAEHARGHVADELRGGFAGAVAQCGYDAQQTHWAVVVIFLTNVPDRRLLIASSCRVHRNGCLPDELRDAFAGAAAQSVYRTRKLHGR